MSFVEGNLQLGIELAPGTLERLKGQLANLERGTTVRVNLDPRPLDQANDRLRTLNQNVNQVSNTISQRLNGALKATSAIVGGLAVAGAAGLSTMAIKAIQAGKEFNVLQQQIRAGLKAVLGTSAATEQLLAEVNLLNNTSPFPRQAFLSATQQLIGFGVEASKVVGIIDSIQEAVAGTGGDKNDIATFTRAFAQIQSQGRLTGDIIQTLGARGIDAAEVIGDAMGKSGAQIKQKIEAGTLGADEAIDALTKGLKEKFDGSVEGVSKTFIGALDRVNARLRDIGTQLTSVFINPLGGGAAVDGLNNIAVGLSAINKTVIAGLIPTLKVAANLFVSATLAFKTFAQSLNAEQVQRFLGVFQAALPILAVFGARFISTITGTIPILNKFTGALGGPVAAIALIVATVPELREAFLSLVESVTPLVEALLPAFAATIVALQGTFTTISPIINTIVSAISGIVSVITPVITFLNKLGLLVPILTALAIRFVVMKVVAAEAFSSLTLGVSLFINRILAAGAATGGLIGRVGALRAAGTAIGGIGTALGGLLSPANAALAAFTIITLEISKAKQAAHDLGVEVLEGLDLNKPTDQAIALNDLFQKRLAAQQKFDKLANKTQSRELQGFDKTIIGKLQNLPNEFFLWNDNKKLSEVKKELDGIESKIKNIEGLQKQVGQGVLDSFAGTEMQGLFTLPKVLEEATKAGIDFTTLRPEKVADAIKTVIERLKEIPTAAKDAADKITAALTAQADLFDKVRSAQDALKGSTRSLRDLQLVSAQELQDRVTRAQLALNAARDSTRAVNERVTSSEIALREARRGLDSATKRLNDLEKERARLLADTGREARELADADAALARIDQELLDIGQRREAIERDQADLADEKAGKLAAASRSVERSQIALNTAIREEIELKKELNKEDTINLDLSGLTADQIKATLAGARAQAAAQRAVTKNKKTQEQINDEIRTAELNTLDATQANIDAKEAENDLVVDIGIQERENQEALNGLKLDEEASNRRRFEQQQAINILRTDETTTAATLRDLNIQIAAATDGVTTAAIGVHTAEDGVNQALIDQQTLVIDIRDKTRELRDAVQQSKDHWDKVKDAAQKVREDTVKLQEATARARDDNDAINAALVARIGLNGTLLKQNPELLKKLAESLAAAIPDATGEVGNADGPVLGTKVQRTSQILDILQNHPDQLLSFLRGLGLGFADGGIVQRETFARIGEAGREVVLPLTRPARMADLLANNQVLHPVLAALGRIQLPSKTTSSYSAPSIPSSTVPSLSSFTPRASSNNVVVKRSDGPATYGQIEELIHVLREQGGGLHVEAPITVEGTTNEDEMVRRISRKLERTIKEILSKRR